MTLGEQKVQIESELDYYKDWVLVDPNTDAQRHIPAIERELALIKQDIVMDNLRMQEETAARTREQIQLRHDQARLNQEQRQLLQDQTQLRQDQARLNQEQRRLRQDQTQQTQEQPQQTQEQPQQRHPSGWTPINWKPDEQSKNTCITAFSSVSPVVRSMMTYLRPFFMLIMPLVLSALAFISLPSFQEIYTMLTSLLGPYIGSVVWGLFFVIIFICRLVLMIRKTVKSVVLYDRLFNFVANHYIA